MRAPAAWAVVLALVGGCALLSKQTPTRLRYFAVEDVVTAAPPVVAAAPPRLRLGRVVAAAYLRERIAFRAATAEVSYHALLRWADAPEASLRRSLSRALFDDGRAQELATGVGPTLEVELVAFDEVRGARPVARVEVRWRLHGDRVVRARRTHRADAPIVVPAGGDAGPAIAAAMARALGEVVAALADDVARALADAPPS